MEPRKNPLIVIEGIDGAGKGSQSKGLVEWLISEKRNAFYQHFPNYESLTGKAIERHLHREWTAMDVSVPTPVKDPVDELVFQCMMTINRYEEAQALLEQLRHSAVVLDRYIPSGRVYGVVNGVPADFLDRIHAFLPQPDVCILIDIPVSESRRRRTRGLDRYEAQEQMQERVRTEYLKLFRQNHWDVVDGMGSYDEVQRRIRECIPASVSF
jgi:dTMP kinase